MRHPKPRVRRYPWGKTPGSAWVVEGLRDAEGRRYRKFFPTQQKAQNWLEVEETKLRNEGLAAHRLSDDERVLARKALDVLEPVGGSLIAAAEFYRRHLEDVKGSKPVSQAVSEYIAGKEADGASQRYLSDLRSRLSRFERDFGAEVIAALDVATIEGWLRKLKLAPQTRINFHRILHGLFAWAQARGWAPRNPLEDVPKPKIVREGVTVFVPDEIRRLLAEASSELIPALALGAFAGLRAAEISRLDWRNVRLDRGHIEVVASVAKTASRRLVRIQPNLAAWLAPHARTEGLVRCVNERRLLAAALKATKTEARAAVTWQGNGLRHSFASYALAHWHDAARVSLELGHATPTLVFKHYAEVVTPEAAAEWFGIMPPTVAANVIPMSPAAAS